MKFSVQTSEMELTETTESLKGQILKLKSENSHLIEKLEYNLKESQKKLDEERAQHLKSKSKYKTIQNPKKLIFYRSQRLEESNEKMRIVNENLTKKVEFFKAQTINKTSMNQDKHEKEKERKKLVETLKKRNTENLNLRTLIKKLRSKFLSSRVVFDTQINGVKQELQFYKNSILSIFDMLAVKLTDEHKKSKYLTRDLRRLKKDLKYLKSIKNDLTKEESHPPELVSMIKGSNNQPSPVNNMSVTDQDDSDLLMLKKEIESHSKASVVPKIALQNLGEFKYTSSNVKKITITPKKVITSTESSDSFNDDAAANFYLSNSDTQSVMPKEEDQDPEDEQSLLMLHRSIQELKMNNRNLEVEAGKTFGQASPTNLNSSIGTDSRHLRTPATTNPSEKIHSHPMHQFELRREVNEFGRPMTHLKDQPPTPSDSDISSYHGFKMDPPQQRSEQLPTRTLQKRKTIWTGHDDMKSSRPEYEKIEKESEEIQKRISMLKEKGGEFSKSGLMKVKTSAGYIEALNSAKEKVRLREQLRESSQNHPSESTVGLLSQASKRINKWKSKGSDDFSQRYKAEFFSKREGGVSSQEFKMTDKDMIGMISEDDKENNYDLGNLGSTDNEKSTRRVLQERSIKTQNTPTIATSSVNDHDPSFRYLGRHHLHHN